MNNTHRFLFPPILILIGIWVGQAIEAGKYKIPEVQRAPAVIKAVKQEPPVVVQVVGQEPPAQEFFAPQQRCLAEDFIEPPIPVTALDLGEVEEPPTLDMCPEKIHEVTVEEVELSRPDPEVKRAVMWLAINQWWESRYEPYLGQMMVAHTVMNRAGWDLSKVEETILKPKQFSWTHEKNRKTGKLKREEAVRYVTLGKLPPRIQGHVGVVLAALRPYVIELDEYTVGALMRDLMKTKFFTTDHYQTHDSQSGNKVWQCYEDGISTVKIANSGHIACSSELGDVVKPGEKPKYLKKGAKE